MKLEEAIPLLRAGKRIRVVGDREVSYHFKRGKKKLMERRRIGNFVVEKEHPFILLANDLEWEEAKYEP